ncbi:MAG TPA: AMP-binding protein, partial [Ottowia sp.]|nr:AMP-binding protein [Ottowia sp.]
MTSLPILHGPDRPDFQRPEILAELFEATAARLPHKTALIAGSEHLSYAELDAAADRVAHRLIEAGVRAGDAVGLWLPRGIELLACQLGVAKTGAAWLPFDADAPAERVAVCLQDAQARLLLTQELLAQSGQ